MTITTKAWDSMDKVQRNRICKYLKLTTQFINTHWENMTEYQRKCICKYQILLYQI